MPPPWLCQLLAELDAGWIGSPLGPDHAQHRRIGNAGSNVGVHLGVRDQKSALVKIGDGRRVPRHWRCDTAGADDQAGESGGGGVEYLIGENADVPNEGS